MHIHCPTEPAQIFEGIPNCYVGSLDVTDWLLAQDQKTDPVELIFEAISDPHGAPSIELESASLRAAIGTAFNEYVANIAPERVEDRFQDYLTDELGRSHLSAIELYRSEGILPFLVLERVFVSEPLSAMCFDFRCLGEEYLNEYGFSFDIVAAKVELATPRILMPEGSYPACRNTKEAEQGGHGDAEEAV